jgi:hypothetical protein
LKEQGIYLHEALIWGIATAYTINDLVEPELRDNSSINMCNKELLWNCPLFLSAFLTSVLSVPALAQSSCSSTISASYPAPSVARGYAARIVANGLSKPRGMIFDSEDHLLVVESGKGITALTFKDAGGNCLTVSKSETVIDDKSVRLHRSDAIHSPIGHVE